MVFLIGKNPLIQNCFLYVLNLNDFYPYYLVGGLVNAV